MKRTGLGSWRLVLPLCTPRSVLIRIRNTVFPLDKRSQKNASSPKKLTEGNWRSGITWETGKGQEIESNRYTRSGGWYKQGGEEGITSGSRRRRRSGESDLLYRGVKTYLRSRHVYTPRKWPFAQKQRRWWNETIATPRDERKRPRNVDRGSVRRWTQKSARIARNWNISLWDTTT